MIEYQETFLNEMKSLLPYFVEFLEDGTMVLKEYPDDCAVGGPDRRPIIMLTHDESTFSRKEWVEKSMESKWSRHFTTQRKMKRDYGIRFPTTMVKA